MAEDQKATPVNAKEAVECVRGDMSNAEVMARFKLNTRGYVDLLKQLYLNKLISEDDITRRGIRFKPGKKPPPQAPSPPPPPPVSAQPRQMQHVVASTDAVDDEFLDTAALTDLLTLKPKRDPAKDKKKPDVRVPGEDEEIHLDGKKGRFSLAALFKKDR